MKLKTQIAVIALALAMSASLVSGQATPTIEGVWQVSRQGVNCNDPNQQTGPPFPAIMTFHRDGTVTGAAKSPVTGPFDTPEYGLWQREPGTRYVGKRREIKHSSDRNRCGRGSRRSGGRAHCEEGDYAQCDCRKTDSFFHIFSFFFVV